MQSVGGLGTSADQVVAVFGERAQHLGGRVGAHGLQSGAVECGDTDRQGVGLVGFAAVAGREHSDPVCEFGWNIECLDTVGGQLLRQGRPEPTSSFYRPNRVGPGPGESAQLPIAGAVDLDTKRIERPALLIDSDCCPGCFVRVDSDHDLIGGRGFRHGNLQENLRANGVPTRRANQLRAVQTSLEPLPVGGHGRDACRYKVNPGG